MPVEKVKEHEFRKPIFSSDQSDQLSNFDKLTEALDVISELPLLLGAVDTGQVHAMEPTVLLSLVPVGLKSNIVIVNAINLQDTNLKKYS